MSEQIGTIEKIKIKKTSYLRKQKYTQRWTYFFYSIFLGLVFMALYMNREVKAGKNKLPHHALTTVSAQIQKASPVIIIPQDTQVVKKAEVKNSVRPSASSVVSFPLVSEDSNCIANHANALLTCSQSRLTEKNSKEKNKDSIKTLETVTKPSNRVVYVRKSSVQQTEIMIPCFADKESLKMYQDKLLQSGIRLDITEITYGGKDKKGMPANSNAITYCNANIYVGDSLYKTVELNHFREFRIKWDTYNTGEVNIKSVSMLDSNYILRKF